MICVFVRWLMLLGVKKEDLQVRLWIHDNLDETKEKEFWKSLIGLKDNQFYKVAIESNRKKKERRIEHGVLTIYPRRSTNLSYQIEGMIKGLGKISR